MFTQTLEEFISVNKLTKIQAALLVSAVTTVYAKKLETEWWALLKSLLNNPA